MVEEGKGSSNPTWFAQTRGRDEGGRGHGDDPPGDDLRVGIGEEPRKK